MVININMNLVYLKGERKAYLMEQFMSKAYISVILK